MELSKSEKDKLFIERLELMNEYIVHKYQMETLVKSGCLHLAKARYIARRPNYISTLQLPTSDTTKDIKALYHVTSIQEEDCPNEEDEIDKENDTNKENLPPSKGKSDKEEPISKTSSFELIKHEKELKENNPLKWFGVLVSQSLKSGQTDFQKCIELSIHIANLQLKLQRLDSKLG
uniref:Vacuolar ATPase assembly protein VMA22 n=1 Tax=Cacopsylla melanoneura TaxID=428564 RepID=A0A8D8U0X9_9HEMI